MAPPLPPKKLVEAAQRKRMPFFSSYDPVAEKTVYDCISEIESPSAEETEPLLQLTERDWPMMDDLFDEEQCRLYYYQFDLVTNEIRHQWALSAVPFEFPSVHPNLEMQEARYVYGCSTTTTSFGSALGKATKIDALVKIDAQSLIAKGQRRPPRAVTGVVDGRTMAQVLDSDDPKDPIQVFQLPEGWFAQEPRFVPAATHRSEDDGYLLFYAFDEAQLTSAGEVPADSSPVRAKSELWIVDAKDMTTVLARVHLPQRVPYGLHGTWFSAQQIAEQRPVESLRSTTRALSQSDGAGWWMGVRAWVERRLG